MDLLQPLQLDDSPAKKPINTTVTTLAPRCARCSAGEDHKGNAFHLSTVVYFVSFVFEDLFAVNSLDMLQKELRCEP